MCILLLAGTCPALVHAQSKSSLEDISDPKAITWEELLKRSRKESATHAAPPPDEGAPKVRGAGLLQDINVKWNQALQAAGIVKRGPHGVVKTYYKNGSLQSERLFERGVIQTLKWYSMDGVLMFSGTFENGHLVHRTRYNPFNGALESEWGTLPSTPLS